MMMSKKAKLGLATFSSVALLAACGNNGDDDTLGTTPVEPETSEEAEVETPEEGTEEEVQEEAQEDNQEETAGSEESQETEEQTEEATNEETTENVSQESPGIENIDFPISLDDAIEIFNNEFGSPNIEEIEFEREDGRYVYDFEGWDGEFEYEMEIDAQTGEILSQETEADTDEEDILDLDGIMTPQEAMSIALEVSGGDYVEEWELELEDGYTVFDIEISGGEDQDVDAHTGDIR